MADEPAKPSGDRDQAGRFMKGCQGGPGRARMPEDVREMLRAASPKAAKTLIDALDATRSIVVGGGRDAPDEVQEVPDYDLRVKAANAVLDRIYGKPAQTITGEDGGPVSVAVDLASMLERLAGG